MAPKRPGTGRRPSNKPSNKTGKSSLRQAQAKSQKPCKSAPSRKCSVGQPGLVLTDSGERGNGVAAAVGAEQVGEVFEQRPVL